VETNWATEHLQVIRTLMERSALYRRALAPIMTFNGVMGLSGAAVGILLKFQSATAFLAYWSGVGIATLSGSFLLVRRQALKDQEPFWSPPTRRVAQALLPPLFIGAVAGLLALCCPARTPIQPWSLPTFWVLLYGCALNAAGFFMARGIKLLGWLFILPGCLLLASPCLTDGGSPALTGHLIMGAAFGGLHLAYGIYLYFTEQRRNAA
jgi:hypothetical protein